MSSATGIIGLFRAILEAIHNSDDQIAGQCLSRLTQPLFDTDTEVFVYSTIGFGENTDGTGNARFVVGGEIIEATGRTLVSFTGITRGVETTDVPTVHHEQALVYDNARNTTALDLLRRGFALDTAVSQDLDTVGRNLGVVKCPGVSDEQWRAVIKVIAYAAKQTHDAFEYAMEALLGAGNYTIYERNVSDPFKIFIDIATAVITDLSGKFYINSGETQTVAIGGIVDTDHAITAVPLNGEVAVGSMRVVSGAFLIDGENFVLDDGVNPAVTFEFDDDASVVDTPTLRGVAFVAADSDQTIRDAVAAAIAAAPTMDIQSAPGGIGLNTLDLANTTAGAAGNVTITSTVADPEWSVTGMGGGVDVGTIGVLGVYLATAAALAGDRTGTNLFTGGSFVGTTITLGTDPGAGVDVVVDYNGFPAYYLPPDAGYENESDFPPYLADNLLQARCLADQIRAAGFGVVLRPRL